MKLLLTFVLALVCLSVEEVFAHYVGLRVAPIDVTVAIVAFLALKAELLEGALSAFTVGYLLDVMSGRTIGLYTFLAVLTFLAARLANSVLEVRSRLSFILFAMGADAGHGLLAALLSFVTQDSTGAGRSSLIGLPMEVALTGAAAVLLYPLLKSVRSSSERTEGSLLR